MTTVDPDFAGSPVLTNTRNNEFPLIVPLNTSVNTSRIYRSSRHPSSTLSRLPLSPVLSFSLSSGALLPCLTSCRRFPADPIVPVFKRGRPASRFGSRELLFPRDDRRNGTKQAKEIRRFREGDRVGLHQVLRRETID